MLVQLISVTICYILLLTVAMKICKTCYENLQRTLQDLCSHRFSFFNIKSFDLFS